MPSNLPPKDKAISARDFVRQHPLNPLGAQLNKHRFTDYEAGRSRREIIKPLHFLPCHRLITISGPFTLNIDVNIGSHEHLVYPDATVVDSSIIWANPSNHSSSFDMDFLSGEYYKILPSRTDYHAHLADHLTGSIGIYFSGYVRIMLVFVDSAGAEIATDSEDINTFFELTQSAAGPAGSTIGMETTAFIEDLTLSVTTPDPRPISLRPCGMKLRARVFATCSMTFEMNELKLLAYYPETFG
ncbi:MAG TPA: hypothetical protein VEK08_16550 [Planctomycetota bacterium]|nr:hypothetical protein [Planctomycetota bacterium]